MTDLSVPPDVADRSATAEPPVRVLIVAPAPLGEDRIGGIANFIRGFVRHMPDDFEVEIVGVAVGDEAPATGWQSIAFADRQVLFLPVVRVQTARRSGRIPIKARIASGMIRHRRRINLAGRVVQLHAPAMDLGLVGRRAPRIRVVHNAPTDLATHTGESQWRRFGWGLHMVERATFGRSDRVYFVDRSTYEAYEAQARDPGAFRFLPNGVDGSVFSPLPVNQRAEARSDLAAQIGVPAGGPWLLFAGRLDHQKDPELLLRSFAAALKLQGLEDAHLLIAGEGVLRASSEGLAAQLGIAERCHFLGLWPHHRLPALMSTADAFVLASAFEANPFVVLEALAAGLPVVSTRVGEVPNVVRAGETGYIAQERTPEALAEGIGWVLAQPRVEMAERCAASMEPYQIERVLAPFYDDHRRLATKALARGLGED